MKQVYKIDKDGFYIEPVLIGETDLVPDDCVEEMPTEGLFKAQHKDGKWIEAMPQTEIDKLKNVPSLPSIEEQLAKKDEEIRELKLLMVQMDENLSAFMDYQLSKDENGGI